MTEIQRSEIGWLHIVNARTDAVQALVSRDPAKARAAATRAERVAEELRDRAYALKERDVHVALRYLKTAVYLSSVSYTLGRELEYLYPRRPCCV